jgi:hypothetical protein
MTSDRITDKMLSESTDVYKTAELILRSVYTELGQDAVDMLQKIHRDYIRERRRADGEI